MTDDRRPRSKRELPASAAVANVLREHDLPVPKHLDEMMASDVSDWRAQQADASRDAPREVELSPHVWGTPDRRAAMLECGWPTRAVEHAEHPQDTTALSAIRSWNEYHNGIVLAGAKGTGKTVAAAWHALMSPARATMHFIRAATFLRTSNFENAKPATRPEATAAVRFSDIIGWPSLCLDDLGAEYVDVKGHFVANLDELIDTYYGARRPLIITTNLDGQAFADRYGVRIRDRLKECADWASINGDSLRTNDEPPPWER